MAMAPDRYQRDFMAENVADQKDRCVKCRNVKCDKGLERIGECTTRTRGWSCNRPCDESTEYLEGNNPGECKTCANVTCPGGACAVGEPLRVAGEGNGRVLQPAATRRFGVAGGNCTRGCPCPRPSLVQRRHIHFGTHMHACMCRMGFAVLAHGRLPSTR